MSAHGFRISSVKLVGPGGKESDIPVATEQLTAESEQSVNIHVKPLPSNPTGSVFPANSLKKRILPVVVFDSLILKPQPLAADVAPGAEGVLTVRVPTATLRSTRVIRVVLPFASDNYDDRVLLVGAEEFNATRAQAIGKNGTDILFAIQGTNFISGKLTVRVPSITLPLTLDEKSVPKLTRVDPTLIILTLTAAERKGVKQIIVSQNGVSVPVLLSLPEEDKPEPPAPSPKPKSSPGRRNRIAAPWSS